MRRTAWSATPPTSKAWRRVGEGVPPAVLWQVALLLPQPVVTLLYLLAVRAASSLVRLHRETPQGQRALAALATLVSRSQEGIDLEDLAMARSLLFLDPSR